MTIQNGNHELSERSKALAQFLKDYVRENKITQTQIGERLGRSQSYVSDRLRGLVAMDYDTMCAIADLAEVSADYLFAVAHQRVRSAMDNRPSNSESE